VRSALARSALRSFFIQAGWNFERMQNLGLAWSMLPALRELYPDKERRIKALLRHLEIFNTHPFMAPLLMGSLIRTEQQGLHQGDSDALRTSQFKQALTGPLAAVGDSLFWATLRPLAALAAAALAWMAPELGPLVPMLAYLGLFNLPHLVLRFNGIFQGYTLGADVAEYLRKTDTQGVIAAFRLAALILLGAALAAFGAFRHLGSGSVMPFKDNFLFIGAGLFMLVALRLKFSINSVFFGACLAALVFSVIFPNQP
jgi:PTS system mannose-specific IID component